MTLQTENQPQFTENSLPIEMTGEEKHNQDQIGLVEDKQESMQPTIEKNQPSNEEFGEPSQVFENECKSKYTIKFKKRRIHKAQITKRGKKKKKHEALISPPNFISSSHRNPVTCFYKN